ncbi:hypothetical protein BK011_09755 [Tenericutes bacterium MZ-XQ]|nr:hypothetical protein BK011_09755 [Tenericutes bacterium MZ-XQ]
MDQVSYKNGLIEAVAFCFYRNGEVLLEDRGKGFNVEAFYPNGKIELKDKYDENYIINALYREIGEEFGNQININDKVFCGELVIPEINVLFYVFLIIDWNGDFPNAIKEEGEPDSRISFFKVEEARKLFKYESAFKMLDMILSKT